MSCPICEGELPKDGPHRPFCSRRCQLIDLGNWLGERYAVPGEEVQQEPAPTAPDSDEKRSATS